MWKSGAGRWPAKANGRPAAYPLLYSIGMSRHFRSECRSFVSAVVYAFHSALRLPTERNELPPAGEAGVEQVAAEA